MWQVVVERFEEHAPASVMARLALERALPASWADEVFEQCRQRQYPRELMFSTIVELMTLVTLGLRPSLHAAARKMQTLPVSLAALYGKLRRTEPAVLRGLVRGSAERLAPEAREINAQVSLPGCHSRQTRKMEGEKKTVVCGVGFGGSWGAPTAYPICVPTIDSPWGGRHPLHLPG